MSEERKKIADIRLTGTKEEIASTKALLVFRGWDWVTTGSYYPQDDDPPSIPLSIRIKRWLEFRPYPTRMFISQTLWVWGSVTGLLLHRLFSSILCGDSCEEKT